MNKSYQTLRRIKWFILFSDLAEDKSACFHIYFLINETGFCKDGWMKQIRKKNYARLGDSRYYIEKNIGVVIYR